MKEEFSHQTSLLYNDGKRHYTYNLLVDEQINTDEQINEQINTEIIIILYIITHQYSKVLSELDSKNTI